MEHGLEHLIAEFAHDATPGLPKHLRLRNAVLSAIRKGYLRPGDQLPPEQEFSKAVGLSLGTVQRALNRLATERALTRQQGRGTFIARSDLPAEELWQFRFVEHMGEEPFPVSLDLVGRQLIRQTGPWSDVLGSDDKGYCELTRLVTVNSTFRCLSRVYLPASRFGKILKMPQARISGNVKRVLAEEFDVPTISLDQFILPCALDEEVCAQLKVPVGTAGMVVNAVGLSIGQEAISFQSLWVPSGGYLLEISAAKRSPRPNVRV